MELKEYISIFKENVKLFFAVIIVIILASFLYFYFRPVSYDASLTLNITRKGSQAVDAYKFDDFYRLQADEKFADTVTEWLTSPRTVSEIYRGAGIDASGLNLRQLAKTFTPEKLSSQVVAVNFSAGSEDISKKISASVVKVVMENTESLNRDQNEGAWFTIVAHEAVIVKNEMNSELLLFASLLAGIFVAFWVVLIVHYAK